MDPFSVEINGETYRLGKEWSCVCETFKGTYRKNYVWTAPNGAELIGVKNNNNKPM